MSAAEVSPPRKTRLRALRVASALYCAGIFAESSRPHAAPFSRLLELFPWLDKVGHFTLFAGLAVCFFFWLSEEIAPAVRRNPATAAAALAALYAFTDEVHQRFVPGREFSLGDYAADVSGIIIALIAVRHFRRARAKSQAD